MGKHLFMFIIIFIPAFNANAGDFILSFTPKFGSKELATGINLYYPEKNDSVTINTLKFYISNIQLTKNGQTVFAERDSYHLLDVSKKNSLELRFTIPDSLGFDKINFLTGIDSLTNNAGSMGGDLDPTNGMYWTWQSGYINFKMEGTSHLCKTRNNEFQFHIGGYNFPYNSVNSVTLNCINKNPEVVFDVRTFLNQIEIGEINEIMSPGNKAASISRIIANNFKIN
jgi:hypothetical protein